MSWLDYLLLALVLGYCLYLLLRRKKHGCGGDCEHCRNRCRGEQPEPHGDKDPQ